MSTQLLTEIGDLVAVLDPEKVKRNANRALDMLEDRGLAQDDILSREMAEVLLECVKAVSFGDMDMPPGARFIATNQRDDDCDLPAEIFGQRCLAMLREWEAAGLARSESVVAVQRDLSPLITQALRLRPLKLAESEVLYPAAYAAFVLRGPLFRQVYPNERRRVLGVVNEVRSNATRLYWEASNPSDRTEINDMSDFVTTWIKNRYLSS